MDVSLAPASDRLRLAVASDGSRVAVADRGGIVIHDLPTGAPVAEINLDPDAEAYDLGWLANPARLLVVSRFSGYTTVHLLAPDGPRTLAEIQLESPMRLYATVGVHALVAGAQGTAVLSAAEQHLTPYQFPTRVPPLAAGPSGTRFIVALQGAIEEWDPQSRMPKRRLRLPRPATITALAATERAVWMTTQQEPARIDVVPLVNRGQPKAQDVGEPIALATGHPRSETVICVGAQSHKLYAVDLDGKVRHRVLATEGIERIDAAALVMGRSPSVVIAQAGRAFSVVSLEAREADPPAPALVQLPWATESAKRSSLYDEPDDDEGEDVPAHARATIAAPWGTRGTSEVIAPTHDAPLGFASLPEPPKPSGDLSRRFSAWRDRLKDPEPVAPTAPTAPAVEARRDAGDWRDALLAWARSPAGAPPASTVLAGLGERFELAPDRLAVIALLYAAHLRGERGVAPVDVAQLLGGEARWVEALGRGELAAVGATVHEGSRVRLADAVQRALDELPAHSGVLVGEAGRSSLLGPCAAVSDEPLDELAARLAPQVGGILVGQLASALDAAALAQLYLEARARGVVPMLRVDEPMAIRPEPALIVVAIEQHAELLGIPRLA